MRIYIYINTQAYLIISNHNVNEYISLQPPTESPPWEGELMATSYKPNCLQYNLIEQNPILGSEDCLYLNVYVPERENTSTLLSVFFSIYGGAFTFGIGGRASGPDFLMDHDVIVVLINYRVGPFGT